MPPYLVGAAPSLPADWMTNPDPDLYTSWDEFAKQLLWDYQLGEAFVLRDRVLRQRVPGPVPCRRTVARQRRLRRRRVPRVHDRRRRPSPPTCCTSGTGRPRRAPAGKARSTPGARAAGRRRGPAAATPRTSPQSGGIPHQSSSNIPTSCPPTRRRTCRTSGSPPACPPSGCPPSCPVASNGRHDCRSNPTDMALVELAAVQRRRASPCCSVSRRSSSACRRVATR